MAAELFVVRKVGAASKGRLRGGWRGCGGRGARDLSGVRGGGQAA